MMKTRFPLLAFAIAVIASGFSSNSVTAHEGHDHKDGHKSTAKSEKKISAALAALSADDQKLATAQRFCPMMEYSRLGAMGTPTKLIIEGKPVFVCCEGCIDDAKDGGAATVKLTQKLKEASAELAKLPAAERAAAEAQKYCAINTKGLLGSMGAPIKLELDGKLVYLCCSGCTKKAQADPAATLAKVQELKQAGTKDAHAHGDHDHKK